MITTHVSRALIALAFLGLVPISASAQSIIPSDPSAGTASTSSRWGSYRGWGDWGGGRSWGNEYADKIAALGTTPVASLPVPILFGVSLSDFWPNFGDPRDGGARMHEGEDIMAVSGTPIVSPTAAVVLRIYTGTSEGLTVSTAAPGGERHVYMHLDRFAEGLVEGAVLTEGALIGYVGNTGNASGGAAHLHYEVRDSSGNATDPYPRITREFSPSQKIAFLNTILGQSADPVALAQFLVKNFRSTFTAYATQGISLPPLITGALGTVPATTQPPARAVLLPAGDLDIGSKGSAVVALQTFLIAQNMGPAAVRLAGAGATGNFGPITQSALAEYQVRVGITPATGYFGPITRRVMGAMLVSQSVTPTTPATGGSSSGALTLARDLKLGMTGSDVLALQQYLNAHGFLVASSGAGSAGQETTYFGPATKAAVARFQVSKSITPAVGYVGPITRAALAQ